MTIEKGGHVGVFMSRRKQCGGRDNYDQSHELRALFTTP